MRGSADKSPPLRLKIDPAVVFSAFLILCSSPSADVPPFAEGRMSGGEVTDGLDVGAVRQGSHPTFDRLVFDVINWEGAGAEAGHAAQRPGYFEVTPLVAGLEYAIDLGGFRAFSAPMPQFSPGSRIASLERRKGEAYEDDSTIALVIRFQAQFCYRVFVLPDPARIVVDVGDCR